MKHVINAVNGDGMSFNMDIQGYKVVTDASLDFGGLGLGPTPKPLMLAALAGCTGMDVVAFLNKMHVPYDKLNIKVEGELTDEHPKRYTKMHVTYQLKGKEIPPEKVEQAVKLSQEKYCGVAAVYKQVMDLTYSIEISKE